MSSTIDKVIVFTIIFDVVLLLLLGVAGVTINNGFDLEPPTRPEFNLFEGIPILSIVTDLSEIVIFVIDYAEYLFDIFFTSFTDVYPSWITIPLFIPLLIISVYGIMKLIRGN